MGAFDRLGLGLAVVGAAVVFGAHVFPELAPIEPTTLMFYGLVPVALGFLATQLQTLVTPTPGRVAMTSGLVVIGLVFTDHAPRLAFWGGLVLLFAGAVLRQIEVGAELTG